MNRILNVFNNLLYWICTTTLNNDTATVPRMLRNEFLLLVFAAFGLHMFHIMNIIWFDSISHLLLRHGIWYSMHLSFLFKLCALCTLFMLFHLVSFVCQHFICARFRPMQLDIGENRIMYIPFYEPFSCWSVSSAESLFCVSVIFFRCSSRSLPFVLGLSNETARQQIKTNESENISSAESLMNVSCLCILFVLRHMLHSSHVFIISLCYRFGILNLHFYFRMVDL